MQTQRKKAQRTCVACRAGENKHALIRFARVAGAEDGANANASASANANASVNASANANASTQGAPNASYVHIDPSSRKAGRGAYLCPTTVCFEKARKTKALERALRCAIAPHEYEQLAAEFMQFTLEIDPCGKQKPQRVGTVTHG
jgi:predicted RNA-binding protein YlxR (DUF448 family)